ncbi:MAG: PEP-CTERM-box response regulator transcription factor [Deltaproteobacteria bacterium]|nr:PEP-CTERM-box response regulator transcription factor [Deltaproteobacteria bacterium]
MDTLLIVDDNEEIQKQLKWGLGKDFRVLAAASVPQALDLFREYQPRVMTLDLGLPPDEAGATEGFRCLDEVMRLAPWTKVIVLTGHEERENALQAIGMGAYDYYTKPINLDELRTILNRAFHLAAIEEENRHLHSALAEGGQEMAGMFGQSPAMQEIFKTIRKVACSDVPVLILGESGTGKEMVAAAIHHHSLRRAAPFVPINCSAIPETLLESELFGHEKGAFTGAHGRVRGKFEAAQGGTLFLDEIGEMSLPLQVKVLRFMQDKVIQRVGGRENIDVDARIISATNTDIKKAIGAGRFREDLFYRIGVIVLDVPPLRERGNDIILLANLFLKRFGPMLNKRVRRFSAAAIRQLESHPWPGNVRELENRVKRAVVMAEAAIIEAADLDFTGHGRITGNIAEKSPNILTLREARDRLEKEMILSVLEQHQGNIAKASEVLGVSRPTLYDLMKKHGLQNS